MKDINQTFANQRQMNRTTSSYATCSTTDGCSTYRFAELCLLRNMGRKRSFQISLTGSAREACCCRTNSRDDQNDGRVREELEFIPWCHSAWDRDLSNGQRASYVIGNVAVPHRPGADRSYVQLGPEMSSSAWRPMPNGHWVRASTGYSGIPQR